MASVLSQRSPRDAGGQRILHVADAARLFAPIADQPVEIAAFAYFDPEWRLLGIRHSLSAAADTVPLSIRAVARDALAFDARFAVMAHNHPSGDPRPSADDIIATRAVARMFDAIDVRLVDHLVLTRHGCTSLRAERMM